MALISVSLIADARLVVIFDAIQCIVLDGKNIVGCGTCDSSIGLYNYIVKDPKFSINFVEFPLVAELWHHT